jgi:hypothetical protein
MRTLKGCNVPPRRDLSDYSARLGVEPCCVVEDSYPLWRTETLNLSISVDPALS